MTARMKIDFVSDVACPWCAVGLGALQEAMARVGNDVDVELHFRPFELNPDMPAEGQDAVEHLVGKYGSTPEQIAQNGEAIRQRGESVGFPFDFARRKRVYNTFDAHRLLHWADLEGRQLELKKALFSSYFTHGEDSSDRETLVRVAASVGLDADRARAILASDEFAAEVREEERFYMSQGIRSVPAVIINERHLISGGQPVEVFEQALRQLAKEEV
ncbi:putative DsbA family dithiol-disulfide isomerase [Luteibacter rhizovicinus]|uniref:Putative DsbA family dithiol-disulfide isomerase n=1 Tax=Luteibacter rhizovicinus TaxID=242606 RepID=A0A4R3YYF8_9GAMM|nr:DsbA family oxidoreductase [Luteibacter rhizovicinus]TCV97592.1 putative DsbA family dithiol-disulfide isomerase [Luteibacter rhizovicinus]